MNDNARDMAELLASLRQRIDTIDETMHRLLIERGAVVGELIQAKGTRRPGAAFRPGREADMMHRISARHQGALPLAAVEHIWREIIATFTHMQAAYDVTIDGSVEPEAIRDLARFMFGFSVAVAAVEGPAAVIAKVAEGRDLGLIARAARGAWWRDLEDDEQPQVMAALPFIRMDGRPADLPAYVVSPPLSDPKPAEVRALSVTAGQRPAGEGLVVMNAAPDEQAWLVAADAGRAADGISGALTAAGATSVIDIGGFFMPIDDTGMSIALADLAAGDGEAL